jgi:hypothetical protein
VSVGSIMPSPRRRAVLLKHLQQVRALDFVDRPWSKGGQKVFVEDALDLRLRTLAAGLQALLTELKPLLVHPEESVIFGEQGQPAFLVPVFPEIDAARNQLASFVASSTGFFEGDSGYVPRESRFCFPFQHSPVFMD